MRGVPRGENAAHAAFVSGHVADQGRAELAPVFVASG